MNDTDFGHSPLIYLPKDGEDGKVMEVEEGGVSILLVLLLII